MPLLPKVTRKLEGFFSYKETNCTLQEYERYRACQSAAGLSPSELHDYITRVLLWHPAYWVALHDYSPSDFVNLLETRQYIGSLNRNETEGTPIAYISIHSRTHKQKVSIKYICASARTAPCRPCVGSSHATMDSYSRISHTLTFPAFRRRFSRCFTVIHTCFYSSSAASSLYQRRSPSRLSAGRQDDAQIFYFLQQSFNVCSVCKAVSDHGFSFNIHSNVDLVQLDLMCRSAEFLDEGSEGWEGDAEAERKNRAVASTKWAVPTLSIL